MNDPIPAYPTAEEIAIRVLEMTLASQHGMVTITARGPDSGIIESPEFNPRHLTALAEFATYNTALMIGQCVHGPVHAVECWYIAGPMRGIDEWNFPAFDAARDKLVAEGHRVISPADLDRYRSIDEDIADFTQDDWHRAMAVDTVAISLFATGIYLLAGWEHSTGAKIELSLAQATGKKVRDACRSHHGDRPIDGSGAVEAYRAADEGAA